VRLQACELGAVGRTEMVDELFRHDVMRCARREKFDPIGGLLIERLKGRGIA
jgi:hypothetical protein